MNTTNESDPTPSQGLRNKIIISALVGVGVLGIAVPTVLAQTGGDDDQTEAPAPEDERQRGKGPEGLVEEGVLTQEQADAVSDALDPIKENDDLTHEERRAAADEALAQLVEDGVITQEQLDAMREAHGQREGKGHGPGHGMETVAETLGLTTEELREELESGKTIAQVAEDHGVDPQTVADAIVAEMNERIDEAVADGRLTEEEAAENKANAAEKAQEKVNNTPAPGEGDRGRGGPGGRGGPEGSGGPQGPGGPGGEDQQDSASAAA